jgi:predicted nicotinamide N-methyase
MTRTTDWDAWHRPYESPGSPLARRLRIVQSAIRAELDATAPRPVRALSVCAGDGRDLIQVLASRPDADRVTADLLEQDPRCVARARAQVQEAGLETVTVTRTDASNSDAYSGLVPADLVLLCGVFGNIADRDVRRLVETMPQLCRTGALVVWTRHHRPPDLTPSIRRWLREARFDEVSFTAPTDAVFSVGVHRFSGEPVPLEPARTLFSFVR